MPAAPSTRPSGPCPTGSPWVAPLRRLGLIAGMLALLQPGWAGAEDIRAVLQRSQAQRLSTYPTVADTDAQAQQIRRSFDQVLAVMGPLPTPVELRIVSAPIVAETLQGRIVVANQSLAHLPEGERQFVLAHELGHVMLGHWGELGALYQQFIPGEVRPDTTDPVARSLGRAASTQAHRHEFEADAFGFQAITRLGHPADTVHRFFLRMGVVQDTATHPGTGKRVAQLRGMMDGTQAP